ncbi:MAG: methionyl-tRNA formyltransferase [Verrucomicrobiae bacterium]|nr:methionyl-tRNA formyltransferase [Verrucomicrobiae bacterium]
MSGHGIVYLGNKKRGAECLKWLIHEGFQIDHALGLEPDPHEIIYYDRIQDIAAQAGIPYTHYRPGCAAQVLDIFRSQHPAIALAVGWRHLIKEDALAFTRHGGYAIHDSLLPRYRGSAPTTWAVINGEKQAGTTLFKLAPGIDAGPIVGQESVSIDPSEYIDTLFDRIDDASLHLVQKHAKKLVDGTAGLEKQDESKATYGCHRVPDDGEIDWNWPTLKIFNWIRALSRPNPGAFTTLKGTRLFIWRARPHLQPRIFEGRIPGRIAGLDRQQGAEILTGDGSLFLTEAQIDGHAAQPAVEIIKSHKIRLGA